MTAPLPVRGRLIALEGSGGRAMAVAVRQLERGFRHAHAAEAGSSGWDASAIFFQIGQGPRECEGLPPRVLILLYACDLAFRVRWQIRPALEEGATVIAAPYVDSAIAFGLSAGLSRDWLESLFQFAPRPDTRYRVPEATIPVNRRGAPSNSFLEFCFAQLRNNRGSWPIEEMRQRFDQYLDQLEASGQCSPAADLRLANSAIAG